MKNIKNISKRKASFIIPQIAIFLGITLLFKELGVYKYWLLSISLFLLLSGYLKIIIPKWHRKALYYLRKGEVEGAIYAFEKSYSFFEKHVWVDKWRAYTMLSLSRYSYREMALMNMIYCYSQLGDNEKAKETQKRLAKEFPENMYGKQ